MKQITISQFARPIKRKPCEYSFIRYVGQRVNTLQGIKTIEEIGPYYTTFTDGKVGTAHDVFPVEHSEKAMAIEGELDEAYAESEGWHLSLRGFKKSWRFE